MKILVLAMLVATTPHVRATIHRAFRPDDFEIFWTANPAEAIAASTRHHPDLLLLDLNQPLHSGWKTFDDLRTVNPGAPAVVLTEHESIYDGAVASRNGTVLHKPVKETTLFETVRMLMKNTPSAKEFGEPTAAECSDAALKSEQFRADLLKRYTTPYELPASYRYWGINE